MNGVYICSSDNHFNNELADKNDEHNSESSEILEQISEQFAQVSQNKISPDFEWNPQDLEDLMDLVSNNSGLNSPVFQSTPDSKSFLNRPVFQSTPVFSTPNQKISSSVNASLNNRPVFSTPDQKISSSVNDSLNNRLPKLLGTGVGSKLGANDGAKLGALLGPLVGANEGATEGTNVGAETVTSVGVAERTKLGANEGLGVGNNVGSEVGAFGSTVGSGVGLAVEPKLLGTGVGSSVNASLNNRFERNVDLRSVNGGESYNAASNRPASGLKDNSPIKRELKSFESIFESFSSMEV
jgi:hypothetical protein